MTNTLHHFRTDISPALSIRLAARSETCRPVRERLLKYTQASLEYAKSQDRAIWLACVRCFAAYKRLSASTDVSDDNFAQVWFAEQDRRRALKTMHVAQAKTIYGLLLKHNILFLFLTDGEELADLMRSCLTDYELLISHPDNTDLSEKEPQLAIIVANVMRLIERLAIEAERYDHFDEAGLEFERNALLEKMRGIGAEVEEAILSLSAQPAITVHGLKAKLRLLEICEEASHDGTAILSLKRSMCHDLDRLLRYFRSGPPLLSTRTIHELK